MFLNNVDSKANKLKLNIDTYLNDKKKDNNYQQPIPSVSRPPQNTYPSAPLISIHPVPQTMNHIPNPTTSVNSQSVKPLELDIKSMVFQGKLYQKMQISLKNIVKQKTLTLSFVQEQSKIKLQIKGQENNCELKLAPDTGMIEISFKKLSKYRHFKQDNGQPKWMFMNDFKDDKIILYVNKDVVKNVNKGMFEAVVPEQNIKMEPSADMTAQKPDDKLKDETVQIDPGSVAINFVMPTPQQLLETEKFRKSIKEMKEEEKLMIVNDIMKIKRQYEDNQSLDRRKLKCPIHSCQKIYREVSQLRTHLKKHLQLNRHGIEVTEFGAYEYSYKALDLALYLGKMFPMEMKKIIKRMKTKQAPE